jgi:hypothetical protein
MTQVPHFSAGFKLLPPLSATGITLYLKVQLTATTGQIIIRLFQRYIQEYRRQPLQAESFAASFSNRICTSSEA